MEEEQALNGYLGVSPIGLRAWD